MRSPWIILLALIIVLGAFRGLYEAGVWVGCHRVEWRVVVEDKGEIMGVWSNEDTTLRDSDLVDNLGLVGITRLYEEIRFNQVYAPIDTLVAFGHPLEREGEYHERHLQLPQSVLFEGPDSLGATGQGFTIN